LITNPKAAQRFPLLLAVYAGQHGEDAGDESAERLHAVTQELLSRRFGGLTIAGDQFWSELDMKPRAQSSVVSYRS
jgi:hypothetical protein